MFKQLKKSGRLNESIFLGSLCAICFSLSVFRYAYTEALGFFTFPNWNLFLAFLPWLFSTIISISPRIQKNRLILIVLVFLWLLFFPNSFYILTDLFHLQWKTEMPKWFDLVMILSYAWVGILFGFMSLWDIEKIIGQVIRRKYIPIMSSILLFLGSFGIYMGRYLRWNSWDIIREPFELFYNISDKVLNPFLHKGTWGMTLAMFVFLSMVYWSFRSIKNRK